MRWELVSSSAINAPETDPTPRMLTRAEIPEVIERWGQAARRAHEAGFDVLDIHGAHGYLIHQFLSPFSNVRNDEYGGSELNRMRFCDRGGGKRARALAGRQAAVPAPLGARTMPAGGPTRAWRWRSSSSRRAST